jgi:hypothetical protein
MEIAKEIVIQKMFYPGLVPTIVAPLVSSSLPCLQV